MSPIPRPVLALLRLVRMGLSQADCDLRANRYCMLMVGNSPGESSQQRTHGHVLPSLADLEAGRHNPTEPVTAEADRERGCC